jgi:uncharacterized protein (DUF2267 family)
MRTTKRLVQGTALAAGAIGTIAVTAPETPVGRAARRFGNRLARDVRYAAASAPGIAYRLTGQRPDPDVDDDVLTDRIRSSLGPLEKRLDVPHIHVMVDHHVAILHGDIPSEYDAARLEHAVMRVSGVDGVESHLHVGLIPGDTRPSNRGAISLPSPAFDKLLEAARGAGAQHPHLAVHAVLCGFVDRVPEGEREQLLAQLPADARALAGPPRRRGEATPRLKTVPELVAAITAEGEIEADRAEAITRAVVAALRALVPYEAHDVAATLPPELRALWNEQRTS